MALEKITLGIDLGTTYSAVAYVDEYGEARIVPNDQTERITPSVVYFDGDDKDSIIIGQTAKDNSVYKPDEVVSFVKREMGKHKDDVRADDNYGVPKPYDFHGKRFAPEEISALILKKLKLDAENYFQGRQITDAIITVPAYFNDSERKATLDAGKMAGLNVLRVINEPTAAAIAYGVTNAANQSQKVFVFDLGGGTFDVTILDVLIQNNQKDINIINTDGDHRLGGKDWDDKLIDFVSEKFIEQFGEDPRASSEGLSILREQSEKAKKTLSSKENAKIIVRTEENTGRYEISRDQFEELTMDLISRIEGLCVMVLKDANLSWASIDTVLLAGGTTRMPMVKKMLERISGKEVRTNLINPDECVALGAAIQATITQIETGNGTTSPVVLGKLGSVKVHDVLSHSLGNIAIDHYTNQPKVFHILKKGTTVPCQNMGRFVTLIDYQTGVNLTFTEGESEDPDSVVKIQEAYLQIVTPLLKGAPLEVTFSMSADGMLTVIAKDITNNKFITVIIERKGNLTPAEIANGVSHLKTVDVSS